MSKLKIILVNNFIEILIINSIIYNILLVVSFYLSYNRIEDISYFYKFLIYISLICISVYRAKILLLDFIIFIHLLENRIFYLLISFFYYIYTLINNLNKGIYIYFQFITSQVSRVRDLVYF